MNYFLKTNIISLLTILPIFLFSQDRIMVISGGGAKGAWGGGLAQALYEKDQREYKVVLGTSTGSLMAPFINLNAYKELKEGYTNVRDKDIFNVRPFKTRGKKRGQLRPINAFFRILLGRKSIGETKRLRKTIKRFFTDALFQELKNSPDSLEFIPTVVNVNQSKTEFKSSKDFNYDKIVDWMWASSNQPVFMSLHKEKVAGRKQYYVDGGLKDFIPINKAIEIARKQNIKHIDVIVHSKDYSTEDSLKNVGILKLIVRTISIFSDDVKENDLYNAKLLHRFGEKFQQANPMDGEGIALNIYFMPEDHISIISNSLLFDKTEMQRLWDKGYEFFGAPYQQKHTLSLKVDVGERIEINEVEVDRN